MSVRLRLTLWYATILLLVLVGFAMASLWIVARASMDAVDESLATTGRAFAVELASEDPIDSGRDAGDKDDDEPSTQRLRDADPRAYERAVIAEVTAELPFPGFDLAVLDDAGVVLASRRADSGSGRDGIEFERPELRTLVESAAASGHAHATVPTGAHAVRVRADAVTFAGRRLTVLSARSLDDHDAALGRVRRSSMVAVPFAVLLASLGGFLLVRKSLAPVAALGAQVESIGAANIGERLAVESDDEFGRLARTLNRLLERIEMAFEQQRQFMQDASHELRTPVAIVRGEAEVALSRADRPAGDYREALAIVHDEGRRLARIVDDLFLLSRADAGQVTLEVNTVDLGEVVADVMRSMRSLAAQRSVTIVGDCGDELTTRGDERLIAAMLVNLLDNAIKHTPGGGTVTIRAERVAGEFRIHVTDTGEGIPDSAQPYVFERFWRADGARSRSRTGDGSGAGLGLPIARWIAEAHGGWLDLARSDATGSTFEVTLPIRDDGGAAAG